MKKTARQERTDLSRREQAEVAGDVDIALEAVLYGGQDPGAAHRARVRALNTRRQAAEARAEVAQTARSRVAATKEAAARGPQTPNRGWPSVRRSQREGRAE